MNFRRTSERGTWTSRAAGAVVFSSKNNTSDIFLDRFLASDRGRDRLSRELPRQETRRPGVMCRPRAARFEINKRSASTNEIPARSRDETVRRFRQRERIHIHTSIPSRFSLFPRRFKSLRRILLVGESPPRPRKRTRPIRRRVY